MRGASQLLIAEPDMSTVVDIGRDTMCVFCGRATQYHGNIKRGPGIEVGGAFDNDSFTDRDRVLVGRDSQAICPWCATAIKRWEVKGAGELNATRSSYGHRPFVLADGMVHRTAAGIAGLRELAELSKRPADAEFAVLAGWWGNKAFHWMWAPVAYPARRWPALWVRGKDNDRDSHRPSTWSDDRGVRHPIWETNIGQQVVLIDAAVLKAVADAAEQKGAQDGDGGLHVPDGSGGPLAFACQLEPVLRTVGDGSGQHDLIVHVLCSKSPAHQSTGTGQSGQ